MQGLDAGGSLVDIVVDGQSRPASASPVATILVYSFDSAGRLIIRLSDGTEFVRGQIALQSFQHPERLTRVRYQRYTDLDAGGPLAAPEAPGTAGLGHVITAALNTEPEPFRLRVLPTAGVNTEGILVATGFGGDLGIRGPGVFAVRDPQSGEFEVTRAGLFALDGEGHLITYDGRRVMGYSDPALSLLGDVQIDTVGRPPTASPDAIVVAYDYDASGRVRVQLSDGTQFIRGQVLRFEVQGVKALKLGKFGRYRGGPTLISLMPGNNWLQEGAAEPANLTLDLAEERQKHYLESQGAVMRTESFTDLAIAGHGFFALRNPADNSRAVTRNGTFHLDTDRYLVTAAGLRVQGVANPKLGTEGDVRLDAQFVPPGTAPGATVQSYNIDPDGSVLLRLSDNTEYVRGSVLIQVFSFSFALQPAGDGLFTNLVAAMPKPLAPAGWVGAGRIESGALELPATNLNLVRAEPKGFRLLVTGEPGASGTVERSQFFGPWTPVGTVSLIETEAGFSDPGPFPVAQRFYRIRATTP